MNLQKIPLIIKVVSLYIVLATAGVALSYTYSWWSKDKVNKIASDTTIKAEVSNDSISGHPIQLNIERLNIDLAVKDGQYDEKSGEWTLSPKNVHFVTSTEEPNNKAGNTLIYGHNSTPVFSSTKKLIKGDKLTITTDNGHQLYYRYTGDSIINPDDTTILNAQSDKPQLTLLTCNGWFSEHRRLMYFEFVGVIE